MQIRTTEMYVTPDGIDHAGKFDMRTAKSLIDGYRIALIKEIGDVAIVIDTKTIARTPDYLKRLAIQAMIDQLEINLGAINTYLDRIKKQMEMLTEDAP
jgi:hypothetical protein